MTNFFDVVKQNFDYSIFFVNQLTFRRLVINAISNKFIWQFIVAKIAIKIVLFSVLKYKNKDAFVELIH